MFKIWLVELDSQLELMSSPMIPMIPIPIRPMNISPKTSPKPMGMVTMVDSILNGVFGTIKMGVQQGSSNRLTPASSQARAAEAYPYQPEALAHWIHDDYLGHIRDTLW